MNWLHRSRFISKIHTGNALTKKALFFSVMSEMVHFPRMCTLKWYMIESKFVVESLGYLLKIRRFQKRFVIVELHTEYCGNTLTILVTHSLDSIELTKNAIFVIFTKTEGDILMPNCRFSIKMTSSIFIFIRDKTMTEIWLETKAHFEALFAQKCFILASNYYFFAKYLKTNQIDRRRIYENLFKNFNRTRLLVLCTRISVLNFNNAGWPLREQAV
jgi:hypothetical protein